MMEADAEGRKRAPAGAAAKLDVRLKAQTCATAMEGALQAKLLGLDSPTSKRSGLVLSSIITKYFCRQLCVGVFWYCVRAVSSVVTPLSIFFLLKWMEDEYLSIVEGVLPVVAVGLASLGVAIGSQAFINTSKAAGIASRGAMSAMIFRKCLRLGPAGLRDSSIGELTTLLSSDSEHLVNYFNAMIGVYLAPLEILSMLALLWYFVGFAMFGAVALVMVSLFTSASVSSVLERASVAKAVLAETRMTLLAECLGGIKVVKVNAWEAQFEKRIAIVRNKERSVARRVGMLQSLLMVSSEKIIDAMAVVVLAIYGVWMAESMSASVGFGFWILLATVHGRIFFFPEDVRTYSQALAAVRRLEEFLLQPEGVAEYVRIGNSLGPAVELKNFTFTWTESTAKAMKGLNGRGTTTLESDVTPANSEALTRAPASSLSLVSVGRVATSQCSLFANDSDTGFGLIDVNLSLTPGKVLGIVGGVGEGKSSLLDAVLGEISQKTWVRGEVVRSEGAVLVGYAPQVPFMRSATVRENITFGAPFDAARYAEVVAACSLERDFGVFPKGDLTIVGLRGLNISGGQKQRIGLARAAYARSSMLIMDDTLSACDGLVANSIFTECIMGFCRDRTRILVTQQPRLLAQCDFIAVVHNSAVAFGTLSEIQKTDAGKLLASLAMDATSVDDVSREVEAVSKDDAIERPTSEAALMSEGGDVKSPGVAWGLKFCSCVGVCNFYKELAAGLGGIYFVPIFILNWCDVVIIELSVWFLWKWSDGDRMATPGQYCLYYAACVFAYWGTAVVRHFIIIYSADRALEQLHSKLLHSVLGARFEVFTKGSLGDVLCTFSEKLGTIETTIFNSTEYFLLSSNFSIFFLGFTAYSVPLLSIPIGMASICLWAIWMFRLGQGASESASDMAGRVLESLQEMLVGVGSIRAFGQEATFASWHDLATDAHSKACLDMQVHESRVITLSGLCASFVLVCSCAACLWRSISAGQAGVLLLNLAFGTILVRFVFDGVVSLQSIASLRDEMKGQAALPQEDEELSFVSTLCQSPRVDQSDSGHMVTPALEFHCVSMRYGPSLPLVLRDVSFRVEPTESIGVVGRTGAGKSSLVVTTARLAQTCGGAVFVAGLDVRSMTVQALRRMLMIVSQDCLLFAGTVRDNLDPFDEFADEQLLSACEKVRLLDHVGRLGGLAAEVQGGGSNFSVGQRQLLCLARMFLRSARLVLVDEATAALDLETAAAVQQVMEILFSDSKSAVLIIAHRLETIAGADRVLFMEEGSVVEQGPPHELLTGRGRGHFASLVAAAGATEAASIRERAEANYFRAFPL